MDKSVRKEAIRENTDEEGIGLCDRCQGEVCTKKGEGIPIIKRGKRRGEGVYLGAAKKSKLPQMVLVFFVRKKDRKKQMVQDYRYFNEWTIKNNYPLPLILDVLENIGTKKVFTKIDLRWGYNNIRIREGDE